MDELLVFIVRRAHTNFGWPALPDDMRRPELERECYRRLQELGFDPVFEIVDACELLAWWEISGGEQCLSNVGV